MRKLDELSNPQSCMSRAADSEMTFVLLGRDMAAPDTIRYWVGKRIELGKNKADDSQIIEALECAKQMEVDYSIDKEKRDKWNRTMAPE